MLYKNLASSQTFSWSLCLEKKRLEDKAQREPKMWQAPKSHYTFAEKLQPCAIRSKLRCSLSQPSTPQQRTHVQDEQEMFAFIHCPHHPLAHHGPGAVAQHPHSQLLQPSARQFALSGREWRKEPKLMYAECVHFYHPPRRPKSVQFSLATASPSLLCR